VTRRSLLAATFAVAACVPASRSRPDAHTGGWLQYADPADAGFSAAVLDAARRLADSARSAAVVAVSRGHVVAAWGAVDRNLPARSVRKSLAGALYGLALADGRLRRDATLRELGVDDVPALDGAERDARVIDLAAARSGVYHDAAYADAEQRASRPARGSHAPGTHWFYNNWDFNALEAIYERATGEDVLAAFGRRVARPLGMEDYDPALGLVVREPSSSRMAAHAFRISARDLARFGQLYLDGGRWAGRQLVPEGWVRESTGPRSAVGDGTAYGLLWWSYAAGSHGPRYPSLAPYDVVLARGTGGQALFLIPGAELVIVHLADTDNGRPVEGRAIWTLVDRIVGARTSPRAATPRLVPMHALPLDGVRPAPRPPRLVRLDAVALARLTGEYVPQPGVTIRVFADSGGLFANFPGEGEAELFPTSDTTFVVLVEPGVSVDFHLGPDGRADRVEASLGRRRIVAPRR
jgi:CubicO group peptidase (beta-lactamase class C family)